MCARRSGEDRDEDDTGIAGLGLEIPAVRGPLRPPLAAVRSGLRDAEGPYRYKSANAPVPLSELEEALLVGAGAGFSGLAFWDLPTPPPYPRRSGRTFPTTRSGGHTALFFTNDTGFYILDANWAASKLREIEKLDERCKLLEAYRGRRRELQSCRLDIPRQRAADERARSLGFKPAGLDVVSASVRCERVADLVDRTVRRPCAAPLRTCARRHEYCRRPAWLSSCRHGTLAEEWLPRCHTDTAAVDRRAAGCYYVFSEPAAICQNIFLATEALGLGGWKHCGFLSLEILERMGFRIIASNGAATFRQSHRAGWCLRGRLSALSRQHGCSR